MTNVLFLLCLLFYYTNGQRCLPQAYPPCAPPKCYLPTITNTALGCLDPVVSYGSITEVPLPCSYLPGLPYPPPPCQPIVNLPNPYPPCPCQPIMPLPKPCPPSPCQQVVSLPKPCPSIPCQPVVSLPNPCTSILNLPSPCASSFAVPSLSPYLALPDPCPETLGLPTVLPNYANPFLPTSSPVSPYLPSSCLLPPASPCNNRCQYLRKIPIPPPCI